MFPGSVKVTYSAPSFSAGKNSEPRRGSSMPAAASAPHATMSTAPTLFIAKRSDGSKARWAQMSNGESRIGFGLRSANKHSTGTSVNVMSSAPMSALTTVFASGEKIRPSTRCSEKIGRYAAMMMSSEKSVGRATSLAALNTVNANAPSCSPCPAPCRCDSLWNRCSTRITAPSTMMPKSTAPIDSRLADMPRTYRYANDAASESGIAVATISAARKDSMKASNTAMTSSAPSSRFLKTVLRVVLTSSVRS